MTNVICGWMTITVAQFSAEDDRSNYIHAGEHCEQLFTCHHNTLLITHMAMLCTAADASTTKISYNCSEEAEQLEPTETVWPSAINGQIIDAHMPL